MPHVGRNNQILAANLSLVMSFVLIVLLASCNKAVNHADAPVAQRTFTSPEDAGASLLQAAKSGDEGALLAIFGPDVKDILFTGDAVKDKEVLQDFVAAYGQMNRWVKIKAGGELLNIGADNYPFPIPLDKNSSGYWSFDTAAGKDEILARRIGRDELTAIAACHSIADAQEQYFLRTHEGVKQYAQKLVSDDGKQNGLYWPVPEGQTPSPLAVLADFAKAAGYTNSGGKPQPFQGYYFRILTKGTAASSGRPLDYVVNGKMTGGFIILAYPAEYRDSGIMTFVVGRDGIVYQTDLGEETADVAAGMTVYNAGAGWQPAG